MIKKAHAALVQVLTVTRITAVFAHGKRATDVATARAGKHLERMANASVPRLSVKEQTFFARRLAYLIKANVPILESLHMMKDHATSGNYRRIIGSVTEDVRNGLSLSKSLGKFQHVFGDFAVNIIRVGETSGGLSQNLEYLADELKKKHELQRKLQSAFIYPAIIAAATLCITLFLMLYLFPKIIPIFSSLHMELPLSTKIVMVASQFLQDWGLMFLIAVVIFIAVATVLLKRSASLRFGFDRVLLTLPVVGEVLKSYQLALSTRTLGLLLKSGLTLSQAMSLTADTSKNLAYKKEFHALSESITRGEKISIYLRKNRALFPDVMSQMVAVGEKSGNLSNTLLYLAELYEGEVDDFTKNLSSLIEPALMVTMGIVVGFIAISIITPIYGITQNLNP